MLIMCIYPKHVQSDINLTKYKKLYCTHTRQILPCENIKLNQVLNLIFIFSWTFSALTYILANLLYISTILKTHKKADCKQMVYSKL